MVVAMVATGLLLEIAAKTNSRGAVAVPEPILRLVPLTAGERLPVQCDTAFPVVRMDNVKCIFSIQFIRAVGTKETDRGGVQVK